MGKGLDTPQSAMNVASLLKADGMEFVARYYFAGGSFKKLLTKAEAQVITQAGLWIVSVFESGRPVAASYFTTEQAIEDAANAYLCAVHAGQPAGSVIYFAVDGDIAPDDLPAITHYFQIVHDNLKPRGYLVGVYGSGLVCQTLSELGLVAKTWLSMSSGWRGYQDWLTHADIVQTETTTLHGISYDLDVSNPRTGGGGWQV
jgi:hypothetical protein